MAKFNGRTATVARGAGVIKNDTNVVRNHQGGFGVTRSSKSELFLLGVSSFVEDKFYESKDAQLLRLRGLVKTVVLEDYEWVLNFVRWLRETANMRSVSIAIALEAAKALIDAGNSGGRQIVAASMLRADEPGEAIGYWHSNFGRKIPQPVKRGIADAAKKLYNEKSLFKYDTGSHSIRFADVIQLTHPEPANLHQSMVFKFALDRRYNKDAVAPAELVVAKNRESVKALSGAELRKLANDGKLADYLKKSGMTWEALSSVIDGGMDAKAWEAVIPSMGYMALLRNLRNFLDKGVSQSVLDSVAAKLESADEVAKSRQLPFRFWSAYKATQFSNEFKKTLDRALDASIANVPSLKGKTLILVDNSGSMGQAMSEKSDITASEAGKLFGTALALRAENATLVEFGGYGRSNGSGYGWNTDYATQIEFRKGASILETMNKFSRPGGGTYIKGTLDRFYDKSYDRVIVLSDEQVAYEGDAPYSGVDSNVPVFIWNLGGYRYGGYRMEDPKGQNLFVSGGLSDASFGYIKLIEAGYAEDWPWVSK